MIRIDDKTYWMYKIADVKNKSASYVKYFLRGIKDVSTINRDLLIKEIDKDILRDILNEIAFILFRENLKRHAKNISNTINIGEIPDEEEEYICFITNIFLDESILTNADELMLITLSYALAYEWMIANGFELGINFFASKYKRSKEQLLSSCLDLHTKKKTTNPLY